MFICKFCNSERKSKYSLIAHETKCTSNPNRKGVKQTVLCGSDAAKQISKTLKLRASIEYNKNPKLCSRCNAAICYEYRERKYCSSECKKFSLNRNSKTHSSSTKNKIRKTIESKLEMSPKRQMSVAIRTATQYSKIFTCTCNKCKKSFVSRKQARYCSEHKHLYSANNRNRFVFTFNVYDYPKLFDLQSLAKIGWRDSKFNPNGYSRDHKISVYEAIHNNYDPYYIKHVMNCELMLFNENNKKKTHSSLTYEELIRIVNEYDAKLVSPDGLEPPTQPL